MGKVRQAKPGSSGPGDRQQRRGSEPKKSNMKPKNIDEQEIPFKLREIMRSKEELKQKMKKRKPKPEKPKRASALKGPDPHGDIRVPKFKRKKRESVKNYIQRMEQEAQHVIFMSENQQPHYPEMEDKGKEEESHVKSKSERKKESDKKRLRRLVGKKIERKMMKQEKEMFTDIVPFGEVAMQPPTLTAKPRKSQAADKPGGRQLLLKSLIGDSKCGSERSKVISLDVELPSMSMARQRIMLEERERVIKAYRALKKQKLQALAQS